MRERSAAFRACVKNSCGNNSDWDIKPLLAGWLMASLLKYILICRVRGAVALPARQFAPGEPSPTYFTPTATAGLAGINAGRAASRLGRPTTASARLKL